VLVAEDNAVNQKVAALMLHRLGLRPNFAANGGEALDMNSISLSRRLYRQAGKAERTSYETGPVGPCAATRTGFPDGQRISAAEVGLNSLVPPA
jgi:hypothetical protein